MVLQCHGWQRAGRCDVQACIFSYDVQPVIVRVMKGAITSDEAWVLRRGRCSPTCSLHATLRRLKYSLASTRCGPHCRLSCGGRGCTLRVTMRAHEGGAQSLPPPLDIQWTYNGTPPSCALEGPSQNAWSLNDVCLDFCTYHGCPVGVGLHCVRHMSPRSNYDHAT